MKDKKNRFLNVVIVILTIILFIAVGRLLADTRPRQSRLYGPESADNMVRMIDRGRYNDLVHSKYMNEAMGVHAGNDDNYTIPFAASDYYEAAFNYKALSSLDDPKDTSVYRDKMDKARQIMGKHDYIAVTIDHFLNLD